MSELLNEKLKFWGEFNSGKERLIGAHKQIAELWNNGSIRLLPGDIEQIIAGEREIKGLLSQISGFRKLFQDIANHKIEDENKD